MGKIVKVTVVGDAFSIAEGIIEGQGFKGGLAESLTRLAVSMARREGLLSMVEAQFRAEISSALMRAGFSPVVHVSALKWGRDESGNLSERRSSALAPDGVKVDLQELERLLEEKLRAVLDPWLQDRLDILLRIVRSGRGSSRAPAWISLEVE